MRTNTVNEVEVSRINGINAGERSSAEIRHEMRNVAMIVCGSATLLLDTTGDDPNLKLVASRIERSCKRALDLSTMGSLQETCRAAIDQAGNNEPFKCHARRILRSCARGATLLSKTSYRQ